VKRLSFVKLSKLSFIEGGVDISFARSRGGVL